MGYLQNQSYIIEDYQKDKPFASFLSGIAGKLGKPLWSFYINRGQAISSFGLRDKNGAILEFYPGNLAYMYTRTIGFRTFVKVNDRIHEFFKEDNKNQKMIIDRHQLMIEETNEQLGIKVEVTYYTLPNMTFAGLARKVVLKNLKKEPQSLLLVDGLAQILPAGIDYGGYKAVSNLLQSWMLALDYKDYLFYKLSASTEDTAEVKKVDFGNYYFTKQDKVKQSKYVYDYRLIFKNDSSLQLPHGLDEKNLFNGHQTHINQVPSGFTMSEFDLTESYTQVSVIGHAENRNDLETIVKTLTLKDLLSKQEENKKLHDELLDDIKTETAHPIFDAYLKQCYLDNLMRGGVPLPIETKDGFGAYHLFSRKHGDLERDYNFFSLEPRFYSQGNGNFRDVLQNRRNDLLFYPEIDDFNIYQFGSLIQADGYNPLSIEGIKFRYEGKPFGIKELDEVLKDLFSLGMIAEVLVKTPLNLEESMHQILKDSKVEFIAHFGEGYWQDHFTYLYDLIELYLAIYPDKEKKLLFDDMKYPFFKSPVDVKPRDQKYVLTKQGKVRQYDAIKHHHGQPDTWLKGRDATLRVNLIGKLITLILSKFGALDPLGIGIMYEAGKPGWNDAMNGLPGLFGSGVGETIELRKLTKFVKKLLLKYQTEPVYILKSTAELGSNLKIAKDFETRIDALEHYREVLKADQEVYEYTASSFINLIDHLDEILKEGIKKAKDLAPVIPTYLTYEAKEFEKIQKDGQDIIGDYGLPLVRVKSFELNPIVPFLEAPARYLAKLAKTEEAKEIYNAVKQSKLYDQKMKFYQTSVPLDEMPDEIGRIKAFQKGWLERESNFLHMTYKYVLSLIKAGLYDTFYDETETNFTCFMDPKVYGRSPLENSSFIVTSSNLDKTKHGQGFVARLSGSTSEMLSIWRYMFLGKDLFKVIDGNLTFELHPILRKDYFKDGKVRTNLFKTIEVEYINTSNSNTYDKGVLISHYELVKDDVREVILGSQIKGLKAEEIRNKKFNKIIAYIKKEDI
ncbi:hypothetical protein JV173_02640 [Acholeplasma equirhinis]|uniref:hypothetical protein n=1 Tax=Acholeplasma equirhinis TaxID=555393 RepID=UPI00197ADC7C|nr:hypothetical protein [Acholeplasma equirhinis]MBN3490406.1 hypothetical protein [Acholeplasma equirhinis]